MTSHFCDIFGNLMHHNEYRYLSKDVQLENSYWSCKVSGGEIYEETSPLVQTSIFTCTKSNANGKFGVWSRSTRSNRWSRNTLRTHGHTVARRQFGKKYKHFRRSFFKHFQGYRRLSEYRPRLSENVPKTTRASEKSIMWERA